MARKQFIIIILFIATACIYTMDDQKNLMPPKQKKRIYTPQQEQIRVDLINTLNNQLDGEKNYKERMQLIKDAVEKHGIKPDDINYSMGYNFPLLDAVLCNDADGVQFLLAHGADAARNTDISSGGPVLFFAQEYKIAQLLLHYGASPLAINAKAETVIQVAAKSDKYNPELMSIYIDYDADINQEDSKGHTLFAWFILHIGRHTEVVKKKIRLLILHGAALKVPGVANGEENSWEVLLQTLQDSSTRKQRRRLIELKRFIENSINERDELAKSFVRDCAHAVYSTEIFPQELANIIAWYVPITGAYILNYIQAQAK